MEIPEGAELRDSTGAVVGAIAKPVAVVLVSHLGHRSIARHLVAAAMARADLTFVERDTPQATSLAEMIQRLEARPEPTPVLRFDQQQDDTWRRGYRRHNRKARK